MAPDFESFFLAVALKLGAPHFPFAPSSAMGKRGVIEHERSRYDYLQEFASLAGSYNLQQSSLDALIGHYKKWYELNQVTV